MNQRRIWLVFTVLALSCTLKDQSLTSERAQARRNPSQNKRLTSKQEVAPNPTDRKKMSTDSTQSVLISGPQKHHRYRLTVAPNSVSASENLSVTALSDSNSAMQMQHLGRGHKLFPWGMIDINGDDVTLLPPDCNDAPKSLQLLNQSDRPDETLLLLLTEAAHPEGRTQVIWILHAQTLDVLLREPFLQENDSGVFETVSIGIFPQPGRLPRLELLQHSIPSTGEADEMPGPPLMKVFIDNEKARYMELKEDR